MNKQFVWMIGIALWSSLSQAAFTPFKVQDMKLEGVQRVEPCIVFRNFPVSTGDRVNESAIS
ncbi:hypothetical protein Q4498_18480, partial [Neptunomonas phycophila]|uniref:hypothetical protein n=1 Tax=Neptunomonas phycophila TaxID=1572645 RepID=UPI0026E1E839